MEMEREREGNEGDLIINIKLCVFASHSQLVFYVRFAFIFFRGNDGEDDVATQTKVMVLRGDDGRQSAVTILRYENDVIRLPSPCCRRNGEAGSVAKR